MSEPLVSVVIPTFNRARPVVQTLDSVVAQTYPHWEAVVVDDGSTDDTARVIAERYGVDPRVRYVYQKNAGVSAARNRGLEVAAGDYIALLDSDDVWEAWKLELQLLSFRHCPEIGMVWTDMAAVGPSGEVVDPRYLKTMYAAYQYFEENDLFTRCHQIEDFAPDLAAALPRVRLLTGELFSQMIMGNLVHTSTVMLTRQRAQQVGGFRLDLKPSGEDYDFHLRTCREGPVGFLDVAGIRYQVGMSDQLTGPSYRVSMAKNFLRTIEPVLERDRDRIRLPESMIRHTLAYGHRWLGRELLFSGHRKEARPHFAESLRQKRGPVAAGLYALSLMPPGSVDLLRSAYRALLKPLRGN